METTITFILNDKEIQTRINPSVVLLDYIRKSKKLTGTKEVCKEGDCGACTILLGELTENGMKYKTINSCLFPMQKVNGKHVVTIEGINSAELNLIQQEFLNQGASQCGFCTPGFIISLTGYLLNSEKPNYNEAINSIAGNICRCTGYNSIKKSVTNILLDVNKSNLLKYNNLDKLVKLKILPEYFTGIEEKLRLLKKSQKLESQINDEKKSFFIGGGTDLFVQKPETLLESNVNFSFKEPKNKLIINDKEIIINASATVEEFKNFIEQHKLKLNLSKLFKLFASLPIRNSATIAGNLVNASPIADITITLLALETMVELATEGKNKRKIKLEDFYLDYKKLAKTPEELIERILIKIPTENSLFNFEKVSKRTHLDIASVNTAVLLNIKNNKILGARLSAGGVAPIPLFLSKTSKFLLNKTISNDLINQVIEIAKTEISPISDIRGSKEYKTLLLSQLFKAHFIELFPKIITEKVL